MWPHCSDNFYPVHAEMLGAFTTQVRSLSDSWANRIGDGIITPVSIAAVDARHLCEETYGPGCCKEVLTREELSGWGARVP